MTKPCRLAPSALLLLALTGVACKSAAGDDGSGGAGGGSDPSSSTTSGSGGAGGETGTTGGGSAAFPESAGEGTLRLLADGDGLTELESIARELNAVDSYYGVGDQRAFAYFADSGNRMVITFSGTEPGDYPIGGVDSGDAVVDVLLNTDATGRDDRIEGTLSRGTLRVQALDPATGQVEAAWIGEMDPADGSGIADRVAIDGALDVTITPLP